MPRLSKSARKSSRTAFSTPVASDAADTPETPLLERNPAAQTGEARQHVGRGGTPRRSVRRLVCYTPAEWDGVMAQARAAGRTPAQFLREASLGTRPKARGSEGNAALIRDLGRSGIALTRLADTARATGVLPEAARIEAALDELLVAVRQFCSSRVPLPRP